MKKWKCSVCGYIHDGDEAPEKCPKCGAPKEKYELLSEDISEKIERSRFTNDLHMELSLLLLQVEDIADSGIEDDLDPGCVGIFKKAKQCALELRQSIKAEIETHVGKKKWG